MSRYDLYLESGPKKKKTMVHVLELLGCVAVGPTTDEAVAATPGAIRAFRRFLRRHGESIDADAPIETNIAEHITEGDWLGNGSPYLIFDADLAPIEDDEVERLLRRVEWIVTDLASWVATQRDEALDSKDVEGRTSRAIVLHVLGAQGNYLSAALSGAKGFGAIHGAVERGEIDLATALYRTIPLMYERVDQTTHGERNTVRELSSRQYTFRKALRRMLEHDWEHLAELSRRPGGPTL